jgi:hypothetical protein
MKLTIRCVLCVCLILSGLTSPAFFAEALETVTLPDGRALKQDGASSAEFTATLESRGAGTQFHPTARFSLPVKHSSGSTLSSSAPAVRSESGASHFAPHIDGDIPSVATAAIEIKSPTADSTVHVSQFELQISVNDEDIDDLMVAVYTPTSGSKPSSARVLTVKRSDKGKKSIVIALAEGANRIEVNDLKRSNVKEVRTITYVPLGDVLNSAATGGLDDTQESITATATPTPIPDTAAVICGQLQIASLERTLAFIKTTPELGDLAARFRPPGDPRRSFANSSDTQSKNDYLIRSNLDDNCLENNNVPRDGLQRAAVVDLLKATLMRLDADLVPKETTINQIALRKERNYLLERTTSDPDIASEVNKINNRDVPSKEEKDAGLIKTEALRPHRGSGFSALSSITIRKQIVLLEQYLGNVEVQLRDKDGNVVDRAVTDRDGNFKFVLKGASLRDDTDACKFVVSTDADLHHTERSVCRTKGAGSRVNLVIDDRPVSLLARAIVGFEQSGAAAAKSDQNFFFDFFISKTFPFKQKINPDFGERLRLWGDFRIASVPQTATGDLTIGNFATGTGFATQVAGLKVKDAAQVFEFLGGFEFRLTGNNALLPSFDRATKQKFSISLIGAFGSTTPLNPLENMTTFKVFPDAPGLPPEAKGKEFITFVRVDRDRFFRQYYAGLRVQTFFFSPHNIPTQRFPAQFDVTIGQNEFVTGGRFRGPVLRMEGFFPLPYERLKFINLFATAMMKPGRTKIGTPLVLEPAPEGTTVPASNVLLFALPQPNRDYYRVGFGIDFISFVQRFRALSASPGK